MVDLIVEIENSGQNCIVGKITGSDYNDARFSYAVDYLQKEASRSISLSLPLQAKRLVFMLREIFLRVYSPKDLFANVLLKKFMLIQMII